MCYFCLVPRELPEKFRKVEKQLAQPRKIILSRNESVVFHPCLARTEIGYNRSNSTKSPALGVGNVGQPRLCHESGESVNSYARISLFLHSEVVDVPVFVCLSSCDHVTELGGP
jgi:hypothetical protein